MEPPFRHAPPGDSAGQDGTASRRLRWLSVDRSNDERDDEPYEGPTPQRPAAETCGYEAVDDPDELRVALRELRRVRAWIGQFADVAAETPGFAPESVVGAKATAAMVTLLMERAEARLRRLAWRSPVESVVSTTLTLDPGQTSTPHVYPDHDVIMVVVSGSADLFWWDARGVIHRVSHEPDQQVCIRRGTRHCAVNSGAVRMVAVQIQATAKGTAGMALPPKMAVGLSAVDSPDGAGAIAAG